MKIVLGLPFHFFGSLSMEVIDAEGKKLFRVTGPTCSFICCSNVDFPVRFFYRYSSYKMAPAKCGSHFLHCAPNQVSFSFSSSFLAEHWKQIFAILVNDVDSTSVN